MPTLDPLEIFTFMVRVVIAIAFIMLMGMMFYAMRDVVKGDDLRRSTIELSDSILSSKYTAVKSVFSPEALNAAEKIDPNKNIELYSVNCDYGYYLSVTALAEKTICQPSCDNFCKTACGLTTIDADNCRCNTEVFSPDFCQCKKNDVWHSKYEWSLGYTPASKTELLEEKVKAPVGILIDKEIVPAEMHLIGYDSLLTRLVCMTKKATELKQKFMTKIHISNVATQMTMKDTGGNHVCLYYNTGYATNIPLDCRYFPDAKFLEAPIAIPPGKDTALVTVYPLKTAFETCENAKNGISIAGPGDEVFNVLICTE